MREKLTIPKLRHIIEYSGYLVLEEDDRILGQDGLYNEEDRCDDVMDMQTANMLLLVYDNLKTEKMRKRFRVMLEWDPHTLVEKCWKLIK